MNTEPYFPAAVFAPDSPAQTPPRVFASPSHYVQGPRALADIGRYLGLLPVGRAGILASRRCQEAEGARVRDSLGAGGIDSVSALFPGECSISAIDAAVTELRDAKVDVLVAVGGGKCVDAGKCVAARLDVPAVIVPTLASNDAPCSALSVIYSDAGVSEAAEFFPHNPVLVVVDTQVIAEASERYFVAGMGDAMATWYEARVCLENPAAVNVLGGRPTLASCVIGERCAHTVFADGIAASAAVRAGVPDEALERVVEANTLLSGVGFESGGVAAAHAIAQGYTGIEAVESRFLHGEVVAMGVLAQLMMLDDVDEARRVGGFFSAVGLPVCLAQLGLDSDSDSLDTMIAGALDFPFIGNMPCAVDAGALRKAVVAADRLGEELRQEFGDEAFRRLRS